MTICFTKSVYLCILHNKCESEVKLNNKLFLNKIWDVLAYAIGFALSLLFIIFLLYATHPFWRPKIETLNRSFVANHVSIQLSSKEKELLVSLHEKGVLSSQQEIVSQIIAFYDAQNAFLLGIIAFAGLFGFLYIKMKTNKEMESMIQLEFEKFTKSIDFQTRISSIINNADSVIELREATEEMYQIKEAFQKQEEKSDDKLSLNTNPLIVKKEEE